MGALWMNNEIEKAGDLMTNIAKATRRIFPEKDTRRSLITYSEHEQ